MRSEKEIKITLLKITEGRRWEYVLENAEGEVLEQGYSQKGKTGALKKARAARAAIA